MMNKPSASLKVLESYIRDVGRAAIRIDYDTMDEIKLCTGDIVEINYSGKKTCAKVLPLYPSDEGKGIGRIDGITRENVGAELGSQIQIRAIKPQAAEEVHLESTSASPKIPENYCADSLESIPVSIGDKVVIPWFGSRLTYKVIAMKPIGVVIITAHTLFIIKGNEKAEALTTFDNMIVAAKKGIQARFKEKIKEMKDYDDMANAMLLYGEEMKKIEKVKRIAHEIFTSEDSNDKDNQNGIASLEAAILNFKETRKEYEWKKERV